MLPLAPTLAASAVSAVDAPAPSSAWVHASLVHLPYASSERLGQLVLNRERGDLVGAHVQLGMSSGAGTLAIDLQQAGGGLDYNGLTQLGLPLNTQTRLRMERVGLAASPAWPRMPLADGLLTAQLGLQQLRIDRRIEPTARSAGLREQLRLDLIAVGLRWRQPLAAQTRIQLDLGWLQPVDARLRVDTGGVIDGYTLRPRHRGWPTADAALHCALGGGLSASIGLRLEQPRIGSSPPLAITRLGRPAGISSYPGSRQRWHGLALGLTWQP